MLFYDLLLTMSILSAICSCRSRPFANKDALKAHLWEKERCRSKALPSLRAEVEAEMEEYEREMARAKETGLVCPCQPSRSFADKDALKAHLWAKEGCRLSAPPELLAELKADEKEMAAWVKTGLVCPCQPSRSFADEDALKAHLWAKEGCRLSAPPNLREEVEAEMKEYERETARAEQTGLVCPCQPSRSFANKDALKAHLWAKEGCRPHAPSWLCKELEEEEAEWAVEAAYAPPPRPRPVIAVVEVVAEAPPPAVLYPRVGSSCGANQKARRAHTRRICPCFAQASA